MTSSLNAMSSGTTPVSVVSPVDMYYGMLEKPAISVDAASAIVETLSGKDREIAVDHIVRGGIAEWDKLPEPWRTEVTALYREKGIIPTATRAEIVTTGAEKAKNLGKRPEDTALQAILNTIALARMTPRLALRLLAEQWVCLGMQAQVLKEEKIYGPLPGERETAAKHLAGKRANGEGLIQTFAERFPTPLYPGNLRTPGIEAAAQLHDTRTAITNALFRDGDAFERHLDYSQIEGRNMAQQLDAASQNFVQVPLL